MPWFELYGMTETGFTIAVFPDEHDELVGSGSVGSAIDHCEARVADADGVEVPDGEVGELQLRGLGFMDRYHDDPEATERFFFSHPAVHECAIVAEPDPDVEEELRAVVVPVGGRRPDPVELRGYLSERLAGFKVPRYWEFRDELPHTPSERVAKHLLGRPSHALIDLAPPH